MKRAALVVLSMALTASPALARDYEGYGDTGWSFYDKRECCEEAVLLAQDQSVRMCYDAGGVPKVRSGSRRGLCDWEAAGDLADRVYRCTATSSVYCR